MPSTDKPEPRLTLDAITHKILTRLRGLPHLQELATPGTKDSLLWTFQPPDKLIAPLILYSDAETCLSATVVIPTLPHLWVAPALDAYLTEVFEAYSKMLAGERPDTPRILVPGAPVPPAVQQSLRIAKH